jgi:hypothetical protein
MVDIVTIPPTFTPASSCLGSSNIWEIVLTSICDPNDFISPCPAYLLQGPKTTSDCLPPSYVPWRESSLVYQGSCPQGYWTACTSQSTAYTYTMTFGICCPRFVLPFYFFLELEIICSILTIPPAPSNAKSQVPTLFKRLWVATPHSQRQKLSL